MSILLPLFLLSYSFEIGDSIDVWVYFRDKGVFSEKEYKNTLSEIKKSLPQAVIKRRLKVRKDKDIVGFTDIPVYKNYINSIKTLGGRLKGVSRWLNAGCFRIPIKIIKNIEGMLCVSKIEKEHKFTIKKEKVLKPEKGLNYGEACWRQLDVLNVPTAHKAGYTGKGIVIGVLDCGFELSCHEALKPLQEQVLGQYDFWDKDSIVGPDSTDSDASHYGHGGRMLSLIAGRKSSQVIGPAFDAYFFLARTEYHDGMTDFIEEEHSWIAGIESLEIWGTDSLAVTIISNSLGYKTWRDSTNYNYNDMGGKTTPISKIASMLSDSFGILLVTAMGNLKEEASPDTSIVAPADADSILAVGGVEFVALDGDSEWVWKEYGSTYGESPSGTAIGPRHDGVRKPEVVAPWWAYAADYTCNPDSSKTYSIRGGTSCATALVAGVCALIQQAHPSWSPMQIRNAILMTASNTSSPNDTIGWGIPDAYEAIYFSLPEDTFPEFDKVQILNIYPNPFKPVMHEKVNIYYQLTSDTYIFLRIYTLSGRLIYEDESDDEIGFGRREIYWNGRNNSDRLVSSGVYICLLSTGYGNAVTKFAVIR